MTRRACAAIILGITVFLGSYAFAAKRPRIIRMMHATNSELLTDAISEAKNAITAECDGRTQVIKAESLRSVNAPSYARFTIETVAICYER